MSSVDSLGQPDSPEAYLQRVFRMQYGLRVSSEMATRAIEWMQQFPDEPSVTVLGTAIETGDDVQRTFECVDLLRVDSRVQMPDSIARLRDGPEADAYIRYVMRRYYSLLVSNRDSRELCDHLPAAPSCRRLTVRGRDIVSGMPKSLRVERSRLVNPKLRRR